jgi:hypothetical protein
MCYTQGAKNLFEQSRCSVFLSDLARSKTCFCVFIIDDVLSISKDTQLKQRRMSRVLQIGQPMRVVSHPSFAHRAPALPLSINYTLHYCPLYVNYSINICRCVCWLSRVLLYCGYVLSILSISQIKIPKVYL